MLQAKPRDTRLGDPEENRKTIYRNVCVKNIRRERAGREGKLARFVGVRGLNSRVYPLQHTFHFSAKVVLFGDGSRDSFLTIPFTCFIPFSPRSIYLNRSRARFHAWNTCTLETM